MSQNDEIEQDDKPTQVQVDEAHTEGDETAAGPAERQDPGNDNPATTAPVE